MVSGLRAPLRAYKGRVRVRSSKMRRLGNHSQLSAVFGSRWNSRIVLASLVFGGEFMLAATQLEYSMLTAAFRNGGTWSLCLS